MTPILESACTSVNGIWKSNVVEHFTISFSATGRTSVTRDKFKQSKALKAFIRGVPVSLSTRTSLVIDRVPSRTLQNFRLGDQSHRCNCTLQSRDRPSPIVVSFVRVFNSPAICTRVHIIRGLFCAIASIRTKRKIFATKRQHRSGSEVPRARKLGKFSRKR